MGERLPAETFPVASFVRDEMAERGWTPEEVARRAGIDTAVVDAILVGNERVGARLSEALSRAFGTSPELWARLDMAHRKRRG